MEVNKEIKGTRNSIMSLGEIYFWTDTIHDWKPLLQSDKHKSVIIESLHHLVEQSKIIIYGFVIMPNHIHLLWYMRKNNGKETPAGSFAKFTAHEFKKHLSQINQLHLYKSDKDDRAYQFWKRDPLAIPISSEKIFISKLDYIHNNPVREKWKLCLYPEEYRWSSAKFYSEGIDEFNMLTHYKE